MTDNPQLRLFISLSPPEQIKDAIEKVQTELCAALPSSAVRWTRREQFHLTVRFLGNVSASRVEELAAAARLSCRSFSPLRLTAGRVGFFPDPRFPRVAWVGVSDRDQRLSSLWRAIQSATQPFTLEPAETEFLGHVTIARVNRLRRAEVEALVHAARKFENTVFGEWIVDQLELKQSELTSQGARHSLLAALPLEGAVL